MYKSICFSLAIVLIAINVCFAAEEESSARLLISKQILNKYLVEQSDILVKYTLFNVGNGAATNVKLGKFSTEMNLTS